MCMYPVRRNNGKLNPTLPDRQVRDDIEQNFNKCVCGHAFVSVISTMIGPFLVYGLRT